MMNGLPHIQSIFYITNFNQVLDSYSLQDSPQDPLYYWVNNGNRTVPTQQFQTKGKPFCKCFGREHFVIQFSIFIKLFFVVIPKQKYCLGPKIQQQSSNGQEILNLKSMSL